MSNNGANKMRYIGTRGDNTLHEKIEQYREEHGVVIKAWKDADESSLKDTSIDWQILGK